MPQLLILFIQIGIYGDMNFLFSQAPMFFGLCSLYSWSGEIHIYLMNMCVPVLFLCIQTGINGKLDNFLFSPAPICCAGDHC